MIEYQEILDNLFDGVYVVNRHRKVTYWNKTAEQITGYSAAEMSGSHCFDGLLKHVDAAGNNLCQEGCPLSWAMAHKRKHETNLFLHHKDGHRIPIKIRISPLYDSEGQVSGAIELFSDLSPKEILSQRIQELESLSMIDPLTRLANRQYLSNQVENYAKDMARTYVNVGILLISVDNYSEMFKEMSAAGNTSFQKIVAETLRCNCRPLDIVGRIDDGLFVCLIRHVTSNQLYTIAEKLRNLISSSYSSFGNNVLQSTVSIGGTNLQVADTLDSALIRCRKQLDECVRSSGNKSSIELHFYEAIE